MFPKYVVDWYLRLIDPVARLLVRGGVRPNVLTTAGFVLSLGAAVLFFSGELFWAGILIVLAGTFDIFDGRVARELRAETPFGSFFDSTLDRFSELFVYLGLLSYYLRGPIPWMCYVVFVATGGAMMVSYTRAKAESLSIECRFGWFQRTERTVFLGIGSLFGAVPLQVALWVLAVLSNVTALQRILWVWRHVSSRSAPAQDSLLRRS